MNDVRDTLERSARDRATDPAPPDGRTGRRGVLVALGSAALLTLAGRPARAADPYPSRPIRVVVPFAAGGGTDLVMRAVADAVSAEWKIPILIENKPGAGTTLGAVAVAGAPADGYTLLANTASFLITPRLMPARPYGEGDFLPVALLASSPHVLVVAREVPASTMAEFVDWARRRIPAPTFASFGTGSSSHLGYEILRDRLGLAMVHVPYRGAAPAIVDLLGGRVDTMLADLSAVAEHVKAGALKALAITGDRRTPVLPDVPTIAEAGVPDFRSESWFGLMVRDGTAGEIVDRWTAAVRAALATPDVRAKLAAVGIEPIGAGASEFGAFLRSEDARYAAAIRRSGAKME